MVKIELEDGEEALQRTVSKYGRIEGLGKYRGRKVKVIILKEDVEEKRGERKDERIC